MVVFLTRTGDFQMCNISQFPMHIYGTLHSLVIASTVYMCGMISPPTPPFLFICTSNLDVCDVVELSDGQ